MIDFDIEDSIIFGGIILGVAVTIGGIALIFGLARYVWGLI